jgi:glycosyltransferase involved in cell wall biosynthesis
MSPVIHLIMLKERANHFPFSGAENYLLTLIQAQRAAGLHVELGVLLRSDGPVIRKTAAELEAQGIPVHFFPYRPFVDLRCLNAIRRYLTARREYVLHTHMDHADVLGKIAARSVGCRRVVSTVSNCEQYHLTFRWVLALRLLDRLTQRHIAVSEAVREHLVRFEHVPEAKVDVVPFGFHLPAADRGRGQIRQTLGLPSDRFIVGFVGRLVEQKNVGLLVKAMARLPAVLCVIVGKGALRHQLEELAGGAENVRFAGHHPDAKSLMPAFDALCLPSKWEGMPLVVVEAMLRRVPVVGSTAGPIRELLADGKYGLLFDPDDVSELISALERVQGEGVALADGAYRHACESFTVEKMVERTSAVYAKLGGNNRSATQREFAAAQ